MKRILVLHTGLFPDSGDMAALMAEASDDTVEVHTLPAPAAGDRAWDEAVAAMLAADVIVTD